MQWRLLLLVACIGSLSISSVASAPNVGVCVEQPLKQRLGNQLQYKAKSITVKVLSKDFLGSGILIHKQGSVYTVLTNAHVLKSGKPPYQIQTPDGYVYVADVPSTKDSPPYFKNNDLAVLQFRSPKVSYAIASIGSASSLNVGNEVFAAGFPFDFDTNQDQGFVFKTGKVSLILKKALEGGYQIGYTNDLQKGMSGGPLLNRFGEVVAINGMHAEPLWGNPYVYQDGTQPEQPLRERMSKSSWGIPIETWKNAKNPTP
ncbi:serine protease [Brasilonema octagenarum UFV-E1]|uniref:Serine protease n=1 Tax=Brasilonema sennae CENA114 TaxID=415709 RepID=A0A856MI67_9CYAN|nr:serine protease [Brasilonema sennae]QDL10262.1 serine protease [Brasilonema sennae CENA114]QDL16612.1 serine protease [Brasilonema octagenarum UFV-E1]